MTTLSGAIPAPFMMLADDEESGSATAVIAPIGIAVAALAFTILAFWLVNARRGRIKSYPPHSFAALVTAMATRLR